jgi:uncharacterized membrane protein (UPF0136 family)
MKDRYPHGMPWLNILLILFSLLNIGLGIYGYAEKGIVVSLIAGCVAGLLMIGTVALAKSNPRWGRIASMVVAFALLGRFLPAFIKTGDWLPAGILTVSSAIVVIALVLGHLIGMMGRKSATPTAE